MRVRIFVLLSVLGISSASCTNQGLVDTIEKSVADGRAVEGESAKKAGLGSAAAEEGSGESGVKSGETLAGPAPEPSAPKGEVADLEAKPQERSAKPGPGASTPKGEVADLEPKAEERPAGPGPGPPGPEDEIPDSGAKSPGPSDEPKPETSALKALSARVTELEKSVRALDEEVSKMLSAHQRPYQVSRAEFGKLRELVESDSRRLNQVAEKLQEAPAPRIDSEYLFGVVKEDLLGAVKEEMRKAIEIATPKTGTFWVENETGSGHYLRINGRQYYIEKGVRRFTLPLGTVTTEFVGREPPKNWVLGPPTYEESITIGYR